MKGEERRLHVKCAHVERLGGLLQWLQVLVQVEGLVQGGQLALLGRELGFEARVAAAEGRFFR